MSEKNFLCYILTEGILILVLGIFMLIFPKITFVSFGFMMSIAFAIYGGFKIICSVITKNFSKHYILDILSGVSIFISGIMLGLAPFFDIMLIITLIGIFFIFKSISESAFAIRVRDILIPHKIPIYLSFIDLILGIIIITILPSAVLWFVGILAGIDFILTGVMLINMLIVTKYTKGY